MGYILALVQTLSFNAKEVYKNRNKTSRGGGFRVYDLSRYHTIFFDDPNETKGVFILGLNQK
jgi:hypothetical protein